MYLGIGHPITCIQGSSSSVQLPSDIFGANLLVWCRHGVGIWEALSDDAELNDPINEWRDQSGNGHHVTAPATTNKPTLTAVEGQSGVNAPYFDGIDDVLRNTSFSDTSLSGIKFAVYKVAETSPPGSQAVIRVGSEVSAGIHTVGGAYDDGSYTGPYVYWRNNGTANKSSSSVATTVLRRSIWESDGTAYALHDNGSTLSETLRSGSDNGDWYGDLAFVDAISMGAAYYSSMSTGFEFKGWILECGVVTGSVTSDQLTQLNAYLNTIPG